MGDIVNGSFEAFAALAICLSIFRVLRDKAVAGVSIVHVTFFMLWGLWNLYYYPSLDQWASFLAGIGVVVANVVWVVLLFVYSRKSDK